MSFSRRGKVYCKIIIKYVKRIIEPNIRKRGGGFWRERKCADPRFSLGQVVVKVSDMKILGSILDLEKLYDIVSVFKRF